MLFGGAIMQTVTDCLFLQIVETIGCGTAEECFAICGNKYGCSDWAYPKLVMGIMPNGMFADGSIGASVSGDT